MTNIHNEVWKKLDQDPSIQYALSRGLINVRALARHLAKGGIDASEDAIISAVRRYQTANKRYDEYAHAASLIHGAALSTKSNIAIIATKKGARIHEVLPELFETIGYEQGEMLRFVQGEESIRIMVDEKNVDRVRKLIPKEYVLDIKVGLAEINLHLPPQIVKTRGIGLVILNELFRNNVLIYELMTCVPEFLIFVEKAELLKAYEVLHSLCTGQK